MGATTSTITVAGTNGVAISGTASVTQSTTMARDASSTVHFGNISVTGRGGTVTVRRDGASSSVSDTVSTTCAETDIVYTGPLAARVTVENAGGECRLTQVVDGDERTVATIAPDTTLSISPRGRALGVALVTPSNWDEVSSIVVVVAVLSVVSFFVYK